MIPPITSTNFQRSDEVGNICIFQLFPGHFIDWRKSGNPALPLLIKKIYPVADFMRYSFFNEHQQGLHS